MGWCKGRYKGRYKGRCKSRQRGRQQWLNSAVQRVGQCVPRLVVAAGRGGTGRGGGGGEAMGKVPPGRGGAERVCAWAVDALHIGNREVRGW